KCPLLEFLGRGGTEIGENGIEQERAESSGSDGSGEGAQFAVARSGGVAGVELSANETDVGTISGRRSESTAAWELRARVEPGLHSEVPGGGAATGASPL